MSRADGQPERNALVAIDVYGNEQLNLRRNGGVWWRRAISDPLTKAQRYRDRAAECRELASSASSPTTRAEYELLAGFYDEIAEAELKLAGATEPISTGYPEPEPK